MMSNYLLPEISQPKLTCFICKKPLSHFPIYYSEAGPSCGRCGVPQTGGYRCEIFEELAKNVEFPCGNKQNGCLEILLPKNVTNHELHCKFQKFTCPFDCPNEWKGFAQDFLKHTKKEHPTSVLTDDCCFKVDFTNTYNEIKLMPYLDVLYVIKYRCYWPGRSLLFNVEQFGYKSIDDNLNYKIIFEDSGKQFSHTVFIKLNTTFQINKSVLDILLSNPAAVLASIEVFQKQPDNGSGTKNANAELLKHFECIVCMDYMLGPIYLCATGHSICQTCKDRVTACPTCKSQIQNIRNYTLEGMIADFEFSCKYEKCLFVGKGTVIKEHQKTCNFIERECPMKEFNGCKKKFSYADLSDHIFMDHNKHLYKGDVISYHYLNIYDEVFFFKYSSKFFRVNFSFQNGFFTFKVKLLDSSEESCKYRFFVEFLDTTENSNRLSCSRNVKAEEQAIKIHFDSIEHLINVFKFKFKFRMFVQEN